MNLSTAAKVLDASLHGPDAVFTSVESDSRTLHPGALFVALTGPRFDGHDYVSAAASAGAAGALLSRDVDEAIPYLRVDDTRAGLARLAAHWRRRFAIPVVGVTGSSGKTTVKEMIGAALARSGDGVVTRGNLNNEIGVPLTLLRLRESHRFAVIEMGMNHPGEIDRLSAMAVPTVAVITNAGPAHLEGLGSVEAVARAKGEILAGLAPDGVACLNADDPFLPLWQDMAGPRRVVTFGLSPEADVRAAYECGFDGSDLRLVTPAGDTRMRLALPGRHNVSNALAAAAAAIAARASVDDIRAALEAMVPVDGRLRPRTGLRGARILDDSYNANPASVLAGLEVLRTFDGETIAVLGDMAELGRGAEVGHREVGRAARRLGVDTVLAVGANAGAVTGGFGEGARAFPDIDALLDDLRPRLHEGVAVLVKGSRSSRMERVVEAVCAAASGRAGEG
jgi:UDP-N-acetylmuramoyl-tripeptide--D-alanyl-D-alanine ligase